MPETIDYLELAKRLVREFPEADLDSPDDMWWELTPYLAWGSDGIRIYLHLLKGGRLAREREITVERLAHLLEALAARRARWETLLQSLSNIWALTHLLNGAAEVEQKPPVENEQVSQAATLIRARKVRVRRYPSGAARLDDLYELAASLRNSSTRLH